jgi:hypothetical protein
MCSSSCSCSLRNGSGTRTRHRGRRVVFCCAHCAHSSGWPRRRTASEVRRLVGRRARMRIALLGDVMLGRFVARALRSSPPESLWSTELRELTLGCDLVVCNHECCISERGRRTDLVPGKPLFRAPPAAVDSLRALGVRAVSLANNHALDYGGQALADTVDYSTVPASARLARGPAHPRRGAPSWSMPVARESACSRLPIICPSTARGRVHGGCARRSQPCAPEPADGRGERSTTMPVDDGYATTRGAHVRPANFDAGAARPAHRRPPREREIHGQRHDRMNAHQRRGLKASGRNAVGRVNRAYSEVAQLTPPISSEQPVSHDHRDLLDAAEKQLAAAGQQRPASVEDVVDNDRAWGQLADQLAVRDPLRAARPATRSGDRGQVLAPARACPGAPRGPEPPRPCRRPAPS